MVEDQVVCARRLFGRVSAGSRQRRPSRIPRNLQTRILCAIEQRLVTEPARYGERLRRSLAGLWKLRVGDYRVCYEIQGRMVTVWAIRNRQDVYTILERRRAT